MDEFAEINRRVFRAFARLPVNFVICHDDIGRGSGPCLVINELMRNSKSHV